jgi:DNA-directed RNA polymerase specialized sigma24 family protein
LEVYNDQVMTALNRCIDQLDEQLKLPFLLRYRDNLKWHEISQRLNLNKDTARKRVSKARKLITRRLRDEIESNREQADSATS